MRRSLLRFLNAFRRTDAEDDLDREVAAHLALLEDEHRRRGLSGEEAQLAARRALGSVALTKDLHRDARSFAWLDDVRQDVRFAVRLLIRTPGFSAIAVLTLALGIGANAAIFSVLNGVLLRPLPYEDSGRLVRIAEHLPVLSGAQTPLAPRVTINRNELETLQASRSLSHVGVYGGRPFSMTLAMPDGPARLAGERVSADVFAMLSARPMLGRVFDKGETTPESDAVVILSYGTWQRYFDGQRDVLGRALALDGRAYSVVGVMPPGFEFPHEQVSFWIPFVWQGTGRPDDVGLSIARIHAGTTREAAAVEVSGILSDLRRPRDNQPLPQTARFELLGLLDELVAPVRPALWVLALAVGVVLLIACANVASLLLARSAAREHEMAVRRSIGAGPGRLIRQALTESVTLGVCGGIVGTVFAASLLGALRTLGASLPRRDLYTGTGISLPRLDEITLDGTTLFFTLGVSLLTGLLFGLAPALRQMRPTASSLIDGRGTGRRLRGVLVVSELALALMLCVGGGLLIHSFIRLARVDPGYDSTNVVWFQAFVPRERSPAEVIAFSEGFVDRLRSVPGVRAAGYAPQIPTGNLLRETSLRRTPAPPERPPTERTDARVVSREFLSTLGVRVVAGRGFSDEDGPGRPRVMLINRTLARSGELGETPIGQRFYAIGPEPWEIVGIVDDVRQFGLEREPGRQIFIDFRQAPGPGLNGIYLAVRTDSAATDLAATMRGIASQLDPLAAVDGVATMEQLLSNSISRPRLFTVILGLFAGVAVTLAVIGLYGLMSYAVARRTREIGIRMALGARRHVVMRLVLRESLVMTVTGVVLGLIGAAAFTRVLEGMLFGLTPLDPSTFVAATVLFMAVALVASYVPAQRATRVDPLVALRAE